MATTRTEEQRFSRSPRGSQTVPTDLDDRTRIFLQPIAAPSILGLFGFAAATFMVAAHLAGWYGSTTSGIYLFPFAATFGGLAQFAAGMWAFRARDGLATAMHGMWGAFWMAYGILYLLDAVGAITLPTGTFVELGYWFVTLAAITAVGACAAMFENLGLSLVLWPLAVGAAFMALHYWTDGSGWQTAGGWVLIASSWIAFYTASAMLLEGSSGRVVLPLGKPLREANIPGARITRPHEDPHGQPGVRQGQ